MMIYFIVGNIITALFALFLDHSIAAVIFRFVFCNAIGALIYFLVLA